ncbi:MAG: metal dependent hydrolase of the beta-lactamase superfamily [Parachlamydiales bacterium]|nr:metal dependent hydrolase of the beta-lactamase superfamily [Parachlamydiales bacterium]
MDGTCLFLGTGASSGIPVIGCHCPICSSRAVHNRRLRSSVLIRINQKVLLIDSGPDFRQQALIHKIDRLDALLLTHTHYDHIAGIDELRAYYFRDKWPVPCLLSQESFQELESRYDYLFERREDSTKTAQFKFQILENDFGSTAIADIPVDYFSYSQCNMKVTGFRFGNFAYVTDIREYGHEIFAALSGVQKLVVGAISKAKSHAHFTVDEAVEFALKVGAHHTWLTHIAHHLDHDATEQLLPPEIRLGYDGLEIEFRI